MEFKIARPVWSRELKNEWNIFLAFSGNFDKKSGGYVFRAAADNFYRLSVNGKFVFYGPERCAKGHWRADELDITEYLSDGENSVLIEVIHYGVGSLSYVNQKAFLMAELLCDGEPVLYTAKEGGGFTVRRNVSKIQKVERFSYQRPFIECYELPFEYSGELELEEVGDIDLLDRRAPYPDFDSAYPKTLVSEGSFRMRSYISTKPYDRRIVKNISDYCYPVSEIPVLYSERIANVELTGSTEKNAATGAGYAASFCGGEFKLYGMESEKTGFLSLIISAECDSEIWLTFDEVLYEGFVNPGKRNNSCTSVIVLKVKKGTHDFMSIEAVSFKYLQIYCLSGKAELSGMKLTEYENPNVKSASFESSDEALNRIFKAAVSTYAQNAADIYMDCPSRERAGWLCDSFFTSRTERDLSGASDVEHDFLENFIIADSFDIPKGMLPMCYPSDQLEGAYIPNWTMWYFLELKEYFVRTGDAELVMAAKKRAYEMLDYLKGFENEEGLLCKLDGWVFIEWSQANEWTQDINYPTNMLYYKTMKCISELYNDCALSGKADKLKRAIQERSFNGQFFEDNAIVGEDGSIGKTGNISEVCQYYAFFCGVADKQSYPELLCRIINDFGPGYKCQKIYPNVYPANAFIGNYLRMEILSENGCQKQLLCEIVEYFDYMAKRTGTLWENDSPDISCNHGFASHVVRIFYRDILGIAGVDDINKTVYTSESYCAPESVSASLPLACGKALITVKDGKREISLPSDYRLEERS